MAVFTALCFFLSGIEYAFPKPLPFLRLGLANLPVMLSLSKLSRKQTVILVFFKVLFQGILSGTLFSYIFVFSLAGSLFSCLSMMALYSIFWKTNKISWVGISVCGSFFNNLGQLLASALIMFGKQTVLIAPVMLSISLITGILLGIFANEFEKKSEWWKTL